MITVHLPESAVCRNDVCQQSDHTGLEAHQHQDTCKDQGLHMTVSGSCRIIEQKSYTKRCSAKKEHTADPRKNRSGLYIIKERTIVTMERFT